MVRHDVDEYAQVGGAGGRREPVEARPPAAFRVHAGVVDHVVAVIRPARRLEQRRQVGPVGAEVAQVVDQLRCVVEREADPDLQAVGRQRHAHGQRLPRGAGAVFSSEVEEASTASDAATEWSGSGSGTSWARSTMSDFSSTAMEEPGSTSVESAFTPAVSTTISHFGEYSSEGMLKSTGGVTRVEQQDEVLVRDLLAASIAPEDAVAVEEHADRAAEAGVPVARAHRGAVGSQPDDVGQGSTLVAFHRPAVEEAAAAEGGMVGPQPGQRRGELDERLVDRVPVHPAQFVVLRVGVVVALLRAAELVAVQQHRNALREHQRGDEVALLARAKGVDGRIIRRPLDPEIQRSVVRFAVLVVFAVGVVVLVVVRDQVAQGEAVVRRDEVDRRDRATSGVLVQVG